MPLQTVFSSGSFVFKYTSDYAAPLLKPFEGWFQTTHTGLEGPTRPACACMVSRFSRVRLFVTPWTVARQAPLPTGFSRQGYWSGLPCPPPGDLSNPGTEFPSLMSVALTGRFFTSSATWEAPMWPDSCLILRLHLLIHSSSPGSNSATCPPPPPHSLPWVNQVCCYLCQK